MVQAFEDIQQESIESVFKYYLSELQSHIYAVKDKQEFEYQVEEYKRVYYETDTVDVYRVLALFLYISKSLCGYESMIVNITDDFEENGVPEKIWPYIYPILPKKNIGYNTFLYALSHEILLLPIYNRSSGLVCLHDDIHKELERVTLISKLWNSVHAIKNMYTRVLELPDQKTKELLLYVLWYLVHELNVLPYGIANEFRTITTVDYTPRQTGILSRHLNLEEYRDTIKSTLQLYSSMLPENSIIRGLILLGDELLKGPEYTGEDDVFDFLVYVLVYLTY